MQDGTSTRPNLADFFKANSMTYREVLISSPADAVKALNEEKGNMVSRFGLKLVYGSTLVSLLSAVIAGVML